MSNNNKYSKLSNSNTERFYESLKKIISRECKDMNDTVVIEGPFKETTRDGFVLGFVRLALTSKAFVIASEMDQSSLTEGRLHNNISTDLISFFPWRSVKLFIFKSSKRKCLKALFYDKSSRYFEIQDKSNTKMFWNLWCRYIRELNNKKKKWPFIVLTEALNKNISQSRNNSDCRRTYIIRQKKKMFSWVNWTDKYLYLGALREAEDQIRPRPVPGLGKTEDIKLLYLKPRYFGCWEQSEHWVQCGESALEFVGINHERK